MSWPSKSRKPWVGTFAMLVITGLVATVAILAANQSQGIGEIIKTRPVAILVGTGIVCLLGGALILWRWLDSESGRDPERREREIDVIKISVLTAIAMVVGWYLISVASAYADEERQAVAVRMTTGWAMAYFAGAFLVGFLFGIPKVIEGNGEKHGGRNTRGDATEQGLDTYRPVYEQRVNTNLEQISDWLTKIIVGLGLVELRKMPGYVHRAARWMASSISCKADCNLEQVASFCCAFIVFFAVSGFLAGYLLTRLFLAGAFRRADAPQTYTDKKITKSAGQADNNAQLIRAYWKPGNKIDPKADEEIKDWLRKNGLDVSVALFIRDAEYAKERAEAVKQVVQKTV